MPRIHLLSETLANQIAAGEVVERPAAVVKELVENAIDSGARQVEVDLAEGGRRLVRVRDDGSGMGRDDAELSLQRHATSKLSRKEDLFAIATYGFRGEALPAIAAVSRFTLLTCEQGALAGTRIEVDGGRLVSIDAAGAPAGTTVEARDLFWNVPARRKFLKRAATELSHAVEAALRLSLPRDDLGIVVREGDRVLLRAQAGVSLEERAALALGPDVRGKLVPFAGSVRGVSAHGLAASPDIAQGSARGIWLFVNGRCIRDRQLTHAVLRAYGEVLPHGRYPAALVFLEVPPGEVDVNVHPAKAEVRLADARAAYDAIVRGLSAVLAPGKWLSLPAGAPEEDLVRISPADPPRAFASPSLDGRAGVAEALQRYGERLPSLVERAPFPAAPTPGLASQGPLLAPAAFFAGLRYLGQLHRTYLVCEGPRGLVLVDQHAAHERMNYQRLRQVAARGAPEVQPLLVPLVVELDSATAARLADAASALQAIGIELEEFGRGTAVVKALPAPLSGVSQQGLTLLLGDLAEELEADGHSRSLDRLRDALLARAACHASVRAHDALSSEEAQALLAALDATDYGARCAHGRPVVVEWGTAEIEKRFGRDYAGASHALPADAL